MADNNTNGVSKAYLSAGDFNPELLSFKKILVTKNKSRLIPISYNGRDLTIKSPKLWVPIVWNDDESSKATIELALEEDNPAALELKTMMAKFDDLVLKEVSDNSMELFKKNLAPEILRMTMYSPAVKEPNDPKYSHTFRVAVYKKGAPGAWGGLDADCYDEKRESMAVTDPTTLRGCNVMVLATCTGIRFVGQKFGVTWRVSVVRIFPRNKRAGEAGVSAADKPSVPFTNISMDDITFSTPKVTSSTGKQIYLNYKGGQLVTSTGYLPAPYGISVWTGDQPKYSLELSFKDMESDIAVKGLYDFIGAIETRVKSEAANWFKGGGSPTFTSCIRQNNANYPPCIKLNVPSADGMVTVATLCDGAEVNLNETGLKMVVSARVKAKIVCTGVWIYGTKYGVSFRALELDVRPGTKHMGCVLEDSEDDESESEVLVDSSDAESKAKVELVDSSDAESKAKEEPEVAVEGAETKTNEIPTSEEEPKAATEEDAKETEVVEVAVAEKEVEVAVKAETVVVEKAEEQKEGEEDEEDLGL
ncbi:hypothetical protein HXX76_014096 [Chlamydomonas incerta]|uniref:Uncharacterized protein n=1 Tax=Chlamydomonas incerta TaxID=51695 RepID=A0A835SK39_CHLIN|nr:hypothetical protein HXX76_014096 [Chlamydomonas incerta]|eukprot:KAG2424938.1 hypothetical protein HXX76_014096 [Chlamydomonas incerta]